MEVWINIVSIHMHMHIYKICIYNNKKREIKKEFVLHFLFMYVQTIQPNSSS